MAQTRIKEPVIIIGCPRSGTTLLLTILSQSDELFSLYRESWDVLHNANKEGLLYSDKASDDALTEEDLSDDLKQYMLNEFHKYTVNNPTLSALVTNYFRIPFVSSRILPTFNPFVSVFKDINGKFKDLTLKNDYRIVEKTPVNCLRIGFMNKLFPDAKFVFISRDGRSCVSSLIEGWKNRSKVKKKRKRLADVDIPFEIENFDFQRFLYVLPPGWKDYNGKTLEEICAFQWLQSNKYALDSLAKIDKERVYKIKYEDLTKDTPKVVQGISDFAGIPYEGKLKQYAERPPVVSTGLFEKPSKDKWKKNEEAIEKVYPLMKDMMQKLGYE